MYKMTRITAEEKAILPLLFTKRIHTNIEKIVTPLLIGESRFIPPVASKITWSHVYPRLILYSQLPVATSNNSSAPPNMRPRFIAWLREMHLAADSCMTPEIAIQPVNANINNFIPKTNDRPDSSDQKLLKMPTTRSGRKKQNYPIPRLKVLSNFSRFSSKSENVARTSIITSAFGETTPMGIIPAKIKYTIRSGFMELINISNCEALKVGSLNR